MKVQTKILLLLLSVVVIFIGGLAALKLAEQRKFRQIAEERARERNLIFDEFLGERGDNLTVLVEDSTAWDDMVRAVVKRDQVWLGEHITDETLVTSKANAAWIYHIDGSLVFSRNNRYADNLRELPIPMESIAAAIGKSRVCHFFCKVPQGWMEVRGATIHPSRDRFRETAPQGYFFAGQVWIDENIRRMAAFTGYTIQIVPAANIVPQQASAEDRGLITFARTLKGWDGQPVAQILVKHDSPIIRELNRASQKLILYLILFAVGFVLLISVALLRWVRQPLRLVSHSLREQNPAGLLPLRKRRDEFGELAHLIIRSRETEQELEKTGELLRHSQKLEAVGRLAGGIAHDFNNLLTAIIGYAELLELKLTDDAGAREQAGLIRRAGEQAANLTRQLLAFSRKQLLQPVVLDLNELIREMEKLLQRVIGEHIAIRIDAGAENARIRADPSQLEQVILNLGVNARDAMPGGGTLTITTREKILDDCVSIDDGGELAPGRYVQLCVADSGCGMDLATQTRIFEPFFTTKAPGKGTGLGLATVYGIVKQSGGDISVESEVGKGSTFCLHLPGVDAPVETPKTVAAYVEHARNGETILVLEDEEVVRDLLCAVLSDSGYDVLCAGSPHEALETAQRHTGPIALLVSDVILPEMHGPIVARKLLVVHAEMKVLFVSGYSENDISDQGVLDPGVEVLQKPFTQQSLVRKVREVLDAPAARAEQAVRAGSPVAGSE